MPTIVARKQANGSVRYTAIVRIRRQGKVLHQEAKTFAHRSAAERWAKHREVALEDPTALSRAQQLSAANCQLSGSGELIQPTAVGSPLIVVKVNHAASSSGGLANRNAAIQ